MSHLPPGLREFGERLEHAAEREIEQRRDSPFAHAPRRGRSRLRSLALPVASALVAAAVGAGAAGIATRDGPPLAPDSGNAAGDHLSAKDRTVVTGTAVADPAGGPPWVVRAYTDEHDHMCVQLGRLRDGVFGVMQRGEFRALPAPATPTCSTDGPPSPVIAMEPHAAVSLTAVYGLAVDRDVVTVTVGSRVKRVRPAGFGAFVALFPGAKATEPITVRSSVAGHEVVSRAH